MNFPELDNKEDSFDEIFKLSIPTEYISTVPIHVIGLAQFLKKDTDTEFKVFINPECETPLAVKWEIVPIAGGDGIHGIAVQIHRITGIIEYASSSDNILDRGIIHFDTEESPFNSFNIREDVKFTQNKELKIQLITINFNERSIYAI